MMTPNAHFTTPTAQAGRQVLSLDGEWDFAFEGMGLSLDGLRQVVPGIWQPHFAELRNSSGTGTYSRTVPVPRIKEGQRLVLIFDGIFHLASALIDGEAVASHANPWTPFEVDITDRVRNAEQFSLTVRATVPDDTTYAERGFTTMLHGKQDWYGLQGGIWKSVRMEIRNAVHFERLSLRAETDLTNHAVVVAATLSRPAPIEIRVERDSRVLAKVRLEAGGKEIEASMPLDAVELWSPQSPALYTVRVRLLDEGSIADELWRNVGFRLLEARDGRLHLNGAPFYMLGALDQDWFPEEECRAPDRAFLETRLRNARSLGLNTLRCHVKIPDPAYFELCDQIGIIVWLDMPYMEFLAPETRQELTDTFEQAVCDHGHHASVCIWTITNEGWGIDLDDNPDDRVWLRESFDRLKALIPHGLLVDNSPCFPRNYHLKTEIEDFHWYNSWPSQNDQFQATTEAFAGRTAWSFSPHGDAVRTGQEPLIVSEFGVWGLPHPGDIRERDGSEPWWFESGHDWNNGAGLPHGIETRFRDAGLGAVFGSLDRFIDAAQQTQFRGLKYQIETLRHAGPISGYVITELNDTQWEANGLMDARNNVRAFGEQLAALQTPWLVIARVDRTTLVPGESVPVRVRLAGAAPSPAGARLHWRLGDQTGVANLIAAESGSAEHVLTLVAPMETRISSMPLMLRVTDDSGQELTTNGLELCVVPSATDLPTLQALDAGAQDILDAFNWTGVDSRDSVLLATRLTSAVRQALLDGRKVLLLANDQDALTDPDRKLPVRDLVNFPKMEIRQREGTFWDGRWMGAFCWRRTDGPWAQLPNGPMLDEHWEGLHPRFVLTGFRSTAFSGLVDAGVVVAWIHKAAAFTKRSFLGKGWLTVSTFDFTDPRSRTNPLAPHVLAALASS
jgi:Beta-galactosidase/beta-glucuronidase